MTWSEYERAALLLAEERVGAFLRAGERAEDAQVARTTQLIRETQGI
jgi:hypothetical protein